MDVVIISASPRSVPKSNSAIFSQAFSDGLSQAGCTFRMFYLSDRSQWHSAEAAILQGKHTVFVMPIFCGTVPGIFLEFMTKMSECSDMASQELSDRSMAFIVHGGLPGRSDFDCCMRFLTTIPEMLRFRFSGIIGFTDTINIGHIESERKKILRRLQGAGEEFARNTCGFSQLEAFWGPDDMTQAEGEAYCRFVNRFFRHVSAAQGCQVPLEYAPYSEEKI